MIISRKNLLKVILVIAYLSAILRPSADSNITLFRLTIPLAMVLIYQVSASYAFNLLKATMAMATVSAFQLCLTKYVFFPGLETLTWIHQIAYLIHIFSLFLVIAIIYALRKCCGQNFLQEIVSLGSLFVECCTVAYIVFLLTGREPAQFLLFGNVNDFGCVLAIGTALLMIDQKKRVGFKLFWILVFLIILLYNDSKLALLGALIMIALFLIKFVAARVIQREKVLIGWFLVAVGIVIVGILLSGDLMINNYNISKIVQSVLKKVTTGEFYKHSSSSEAFRTNAIVGLLQIMKESCCIGVGFGNSSLILKDLMPDMYGELAKHSYVASHTWWLEVMSDGGIIVIVLALKCYLKQVYIFFSQRSDTNQLFSNMLVISFPIWCMSSSGLYTEFFSISMLAVAVVMINNPTRRITLKYRR